MPQSFMLGITYGLVLLFVFGIFTLLGGRYLYLLRLKEHMASVSLISMFHLMGSVTDVFLSQFTKFRTIIYLQTQLLISI